MKHFKFAIFTMTVLVFLVQACISPSDPDGLKSENIITIDTIGYCKDFAFNDTLMVLAANENGYMVYEYEFDADGQFHYNFLYGDNDLFNDGSGIDEISSVQISEQYPLLYLMDHSDGVYYAHIGQPEVPGATGKLTGGVSDNRDIVRSIILDDSRFEEPIIYALRKPGGGNNYTEITTRFMEIYDWGFGTLTIYDDNNTSQFNLAEAAESIFLSDSLVSVTNSELGAVVYKQAHDGVLSEFSEFDTPGTGQSIYSVENRIFVGLAEDYGCYTALLDLDGSIVSTFNIAEGYSVRSIHFNEGVLALACGNDGVLLYNWNGDPANAEFTEMGWLESDYAYRVQVFDSQNIFVATRGGLQLFNFDN